MLRFCFAGFVVLSGLIGGEVAHQREFTFQYQATVKDLPAGTEKVELWIPLPHDDAYQRISSLEVQTPYPYRIAAGDQGNKILHLEIGRPKESSIP